MFIIKSPSTNATGYVPGTEWTVGTNYNAWRNDSYQFVNGHAFGGTGTNLYVGSFYPTNDLALTWTNGYVDNTFGWTGMVFRSQRYAMYDFDVDLRLELEAPTNGTVTTVGVGLYIAEAATTNNYVIKWGDFERVVHDDSADIAGLPWVHHSHMSYTHALYDDWVACPVVVLESSWTDITNILYGVRNQDTDLPNRFELQWTGHQIADDFDTLP
jgi:hypothetical protein